eukprot:TRINITY_DN43260_c0_g1_i1.p1 TRINITY_DN43260_c0_g1~~TRINITY_DN43260_c0_g1_i1.p1  ORF type:complete len:800 (+),score=130.45 TRINITY_DN43260_c0_g1_i1:100-2499(+)
MPWGNQRKRKPAFGAAGVVNTDDATLFSVRTESWRTDAGLPSSASEVSGSPSPHTWHRHGLGPGHVVSPSAQARFRGAVSARQDGQNWVAVGGMSRTTAIADWREQEAALEVPKLDDIVNVAHGPRHVDPRCEGNTRFDDLNIADSDVCEDVGRPGFSRSTFVAGVSEAVQTSAVDSGRSHAGYPRVVPRALNFGEQRPARKAWADISDDSESDVAEFFGGSGGDEISTCCKRDAPSADVSVSGQNLQGRFNDEVSSIEGRSSDEAPLQATQSLSAQDGATALERRLNDEALSRASVQAWASEVQTLSERLRSLVDSAPCGSMEQRAAEARTSTAVPLCTAETNTERLDLSFLSSAALRHKALLVETTTSQEAAREALATAEAHCAAASQLRNAAATVTESLQTPSVDTTGLVEAELAASDSAAAAVEAESSAMAFGAACRANIADLRDAVACEVRKAEESENMASRLMGSRANLQEIPDLVARRLSSERRAHSLREACERVLRLVEPLRDELNVVTRGTGTRVEAAEARVARLKTTCKELQAAEEAASSKGAIVQIVSISSASVMEADLKDAKQRNTRHLAEVREARSNRDRIAMRLQTLREEVLATQESLIICGDERDGMEDQLLLLRGAEDAARREVESRREHLDDLDRQRREAEQVAAETRDRHREVEATTRKFIQERRRAEEAEARIERRLQQTVSQLEKERKSAPFIKILQQDRLLATQGGASGSSAGMGVGGCASGGGSGGPWCRNSRAKLGAASRLPPPRGHRGGCQPEDDGHDGEATTTAGEESMTEGVV